MRNFSYILALHSSVLNFYIMATRGKPTADQVPEIFVDSDSELDVNEHSDEEFSNHSDKEDFEEDSEINRNGNYLDFETDVLSNYDTNSDGNDNIFQTVLHDSNSVLNCKEQSRSQGRANLATQGTNIVWGRADRAVQVLPFNNHIGPTVLVDISDAWDIFRLFMPKELVQIIVDETNRYARQYFAETPLSPHARGKSWREVTPEEMEKFLGLVLLTGIIQKPMLKQYWSTDKILATPFFNDTVPRNRFELILKFLHFNDNLAKPDDCMDKLYKLRPVHGLIVSKWRDFYDPGEQLSIDEGTFKWKRRLTFHVHKNKFIKYGIKGHMLCDSQTAYCWNLDLYHGQGITIYEIVIRLLNRLLNSPYSLYIGNFYNSVKLSTELLNDYKIYTCGTLK